jgi:DnaJ-related protein SCJ1
MDIEMTLAELFSGISFDMEINKQILCPMCRGSGAKDENDVHTCTSCGGNGVKVVRHQIAPGFFQQVQQKCEVCNGKGKVIKTKCPHCKGTKTKRGSHEFTLEIEKGMGQGQKIVFEGEADEDPDANAGNLVFVIVVSTS